MITPLTNDNLLQTIFSFLDPKTLGKARLVCKNWNTNGQVEALWKRFCVEMGATQPLNKLWRLRFYALQNCRRGLYCQESFSIPEKAPAYFENNQIFFIKISNLNLELVNYYANTSAIFNTNFQSKIVVLHPNYLIAVNQVGHILLFDRYTQALVRTIPTYIGKVISHLICDEHSIFVYTNRQEIERWELATGLLIQAKQIPFTSLTYLNIATNFLIIEGKGQRSGIDILSLNTLESILTPNSPLFHAPLAETIFSPGSHIALHPHRLWLAVMELNKRITVWDLNKLGQTPIFYNQSSAKEKGEIKCICSTWKNDVLFVSYSFYREIVFFTSFQGSKIESWDIQNNQLLQEYPYTHMPKKIEPFSNGLAITAHSQVLILNFT